MAKFERAWGVGPQPSSQGIMATECFPAMLDGQASKGMFIFGEDPVRTDPDTRHVIHALESLEFLVVDELFLTETAQLRRRRAARAELRGEGGHVHQHRAARAARAQGGGGPPAETMARHGHLHRGHEPHGVRPAAHERRCRSWTKSPRSRPLTRGVSHARLDGDGGCRSRIAVALHRARIILERRSSMSGEFSRGAWALYSLAGYLRADRANR